jgi:hypothetical protein
MTEEPGEPWCVNITEKPSGGAPKQRNPNAGECRRGAFAKTHTGRQNIN